MKLKRLYLSVALGGMLIAACSVFSSAHARTWTDSTGGFTVEAEFVSLVDGVVALRTPAGKLIKIPLARLGDADRALAKSKVSKKTGAGPAPEMGKISATATGKLKTWFSQKNGKKTEVTRLTIDVELSGGIIADVYSFIAPNAEPIRVGDKQIAQKRTFSSDFYELVEGEGEPADRKIQAELDFGEVPPDTGSVDSLKGAVDVCVGGKERVIVIADPLKHPVGMLDHPVLKEMGIEVKFVRHQISETSAYVVDFDKEDIYVFAGLEVVKKDGTVVERVSGASSSDDKEGRSISVENHQLEGNVLRLRLRDGARKMKIPFKFETVDIK